MKSNAERQKAYRERKKAEKNKLSREEAGKVSGSPDMGAEGRCESCSSLDLQADAERYRKELMPEPVLDEPMTTFDVYKRRLEREARR